MSKLWTPKQMIGRLDRESLTKERPSKWDDMRELSQLLSAEMPWKQQLGQMWINGELMGVAGGLGGLEANPPGADLAAVTVNATEAAMWPASTYTPIPALQVAPKAYFLRAYGVCTSAATPGTQTFNPRIGTSSSGISISGASSNLTPTASETACVWRIMGDMVTRSAGTTTATTTGFFSYDQTSGTSGNAGAVAGTPLYFGGTSASWDNTATQALFMGLVAATSTTNTMTPRLIIWASWN